ncbi:MAG TPA: glycine cleavage T C-terminal barrel domain-containing protein, partial [Thermomicrobiales bacterium]|nr:glycine cleavage T C-terminal barrel domain-containing protein [Thermomicrobiales bacterium]
REIGIARRLVRFRLDDPEPVLWGHEPILRDGKPVGFTSSGAYGHATGSSVAMGYVQGTAPINRDWIDAGTYTIEVAGRQCPASIVRRQN